MLIPVETTRSPQDSLQASVRQVMVLGVAVIKVQEVSPMVTPVDFMLPLKPPPETVMTWPPWMDPDAGVTPDIAMFDLSWARLLTAFPTPPFLLTTTVYFPAGSSGKERVMEVSVTAETVAS